MPIIPAAHDRFFRETFGRQDIARGFLVRYLPADLLEAMFH